MGNIANLLTEIEDRLREIDAERDDLLRMRQRYAGVTPTAAAQASGNGSLHHGRATKVEPMGMSDAIRHVVRGAGAEGILTSAMVTKVLEVATTGSSNPRRAVESTAYNMRKSGRIRFNDGKYYWGHE